MPGLASKAEASPRVPISIGHSAQASFVMNRRPKRDPMSVLMSIKRKARANEPRPLAAVPPDEVAAFQRLREIIEQSKLLQFLDKRQQTEKGERCVCVNEVLVSQQYPGLDPLAGSLTKIDAFIYVYDGMTGSQIPRPSAKGDLRQYLGEVGFRQMLLALQKGCEIHRFCTDHLRSDSVVIEPMTKKHTIDARKEAFAMHARAKEVFQQIAQKINDEIAASDADTPQVYQDAFQFAREMKAALEPLAAMGRQIRASLRLATG
jgi:hypothetical protein